MNVFEAVKQSVTTRQAALVYGIAARPVAAQTKGRGTIKILLFCVVIAVWTATFGGFGGKSEGVPWQSAKQKRQKC